MATVMTEKPRTKFVLGFALGFSLPSFLIVMYLALGQRWVSYASWQVTIAIWVCSVVLWEHARARWLARGAMYGSVSSIALFLFLAGVTASL
jgi:hypothetical protein